VPRVKEFDEVEALDKAMALFWEKGYARTSVRDLVKHTGVAHAGLYNVFQDKRGLFDCALEKYVSENDDTILCSLENEDSGLQSIHDIFDIAIERVKSSSFRDGCFLVNSASEFGNGDAAVQKIVGRSLERQKKAFTNALVNGVNAGDISPTKNITEMADFLASSLNGLSTMARIGAPVEMIENTVKSIQSMLK